jgi:hypothetical protein
MFRQKDTSDVNSSAPVYLRLLHFFSMTHNYPLPFKTYDPLGGCGPPIEHNILPHQREIVPRLPRHIQQTVLPT